MGILKVEGVTHWSIPVNDLAESEKFYGELDRKSTRLNSSHRL